jgi:hypothetical protein
MPPDPGAAAVLSATLRALQSDRRMQTDIARFQRTCCVPQRLVKLQGAPLPTGVSTREA